MVKIIKEFTERTKSETAINRKTKKDYCVCNIETKAVTIYTCRIVYTRLIVLNHGYISHQKCQSLSGLVGFTIRPD